jgi:hypothetical protein
MVESEKKSLVWNALKYSVSQVKEIWKHLILQTIWSSYASPSTGEEAEI